jgi:hypothetical protein
MKGKIPRMESIIVQKTINNTSNSHWLPVSFSIIIDDLGEIHDMEPNVAKRMWELLGEFFDEKN